MPAQGLQKIGNLHGYPNPIWYDSEGIANILSLANVRKIFRVTFDSDKGNVFSVYMKNKTVEFKQSKEDLYFHDVRTSGSVFMTMKMKQHLAIAPPLGVQRNNCEGQ